MMLIRENFLYLYPSEFASNILSPVTNQKP
jgi:hypothetical protein